MNDQMAAQIVRTLAAGELPALPVAAPAEGSGDSAPTTLEIRRALFLAVDALEQRARLDERRQATPARNAGKPWTAAEDEELLAKFDAGVALEAIAAAHGRTRTGIEARLVKHGRLDERSVRGGLGLRYAAKERAPPG
jgi:hypothetical protein